MSEIVIKRVDFRDPADASAFVAMVDAYARDPLGKDSPLDDAVRARLPECIAEHPSSLGWLAWLEGEPVGVLTALVGFSTFQARSLINVHDVAVEKGHRGKGIGWRLLEAVEAHARAADCCALTLEVRGDNLPAQRLYRKFGFLGSGDIAPETAMAFWKKPLE